MVSFIIISKDRAKRESHVKELALQHKVDQFDITIIDKETASKNINSIGIETVIIIKEKLFLKPIGKTKILVIEDAQALTPQAQNALLKLLEEPPDHTVIALCTDSTEALLPTIRSRCQIIALEVEDVKLSEKEIKEIKAFIESLPTLSVGEKLKHAEKLAKDKDKTIIWLEKLILQLRESLLANVADNNVTMQQFNNEIRSFQTLHTTLKTTNVNARFAIENTLLSL